MITDATIPKSVNDLVDFVYRWTLPIATAMAAVGTISMAILQTVKDTTPLRNWFQRRRLKMWISGKIQQVKLEGVTVVSLEQQLTLLATDGDLKALYDLTIEQMCGQINTAAQLALDYPSKFPKLVQVLASAADPEDVKQLMSPPAVVRQPRSSLQGADAVAFDAYVDARNRVAHQVQRAIDGFQISTSFRWKFGLQFASIALSSVIAGWAVAYFGRESDTQKQVMLTLFAAVLGGFLAPVARDIVAALQQLRK